MNAVKTSGLNVNRMAKAIGDGRKDGLLIDCARLLGTHYGKMVEHFSAREGQPLSAHNNKTLFLEGIDLWCRSVFTNKKGSTKTSDPREVVEAAMTPWYEAMSLDNPGKYRMGRLPAIPVYVGDPSDALCLELGLCACLDVTPIRLKLGGYKNGDNEVFEHVWGIVQADGNWYDTDPTDAELVMGQAREYPHYKELEVPL